jgi:exonuclease VII small subunit
VLLALLGGAFVIWQRVIMLERNLRHRLGTVEQRVSDLREQSNKWVAGP